MSPSSGTPLSGPVTAGHVGAPVLEEQPGSLAPSPPRCAAAGGEAGRRRDGATRSPGCGPEVCAPQISAHVRCTRELRPRGLQGGDSAGEVLAGLGCFKS